MASLSKWASPYTHIFHCITIKNPCIPTSLWLWELWLAGWHHEPELIGRAWFRVTDAVGRFWVGSSCWPSSESNNQNLSRCTKRYRPDQEGSSPSESSGRPVDQGDRTPLRHHQRSFSFKCEDIYILCHLINLCIYSDNHLNAHLLWWLWFSWLKFILGIFVRSKMSCWFNCPEFVCRYS